MLSQTVWIICLRWCNNSFVNMHNFTLIYFVFANLCEPL